MVQQLHRIVLEGSNYILDLEELLAIRYPDKNEKERHLLLAGILNGLVEAISIADQQRSLYNLLFYISSIDDRMGVTRHFTIDKRYTFNRLLKEFGLSLHQQMTVWKLFDANGRLQYHYYRVDDPGFKEIALNSILQLGWNGQFHEPFN